MTAPRKPSAAPAPYSYRVIERVVFEYVWTVESERPLTKAEIEERIRARGDGEAVSHDEDERAIMSIEPQPERATPDGREAARR